MTTSNNPSNVAGGLPTWNYALNQPVSPLVADWTVTSNDETGGINVVPEPFSMVTVGMAVLGIGGYIRRRRLA